jgi:outer membrane protein TolC
MMKTGRRTALMLAAAAIALARPAAAQSDAASAPAPRDLPVITIMEAVDSALASGEELKIADGTLAGARATYDQARSKKGLSLSASGSYSLTDNFGADLSGPASSSLAKLVGSEGLSQSLQGGLAVGLGPITKLSLSASESIPPSPGSATTSLGATLSQTIWDGYPGGQASAAVDRAAITLKGKELDAAQTRSAIVSNVKKSYVSMLTAQRTLALNGSTLDKQTALLRQIETTYALQQSSALDLMNAQASAREAELALADSVHSLETATRTLAAYMGRDPAIAFAVAELEEPALPAASADEAVAAGLDRRPDLARNALSRRSASIDLATARSASQPSVSASAGLKMGITGGSTPGDAYQATLGVSISMPILDSGAADAQVAAASALAGSADAQARQLARSVETDIRDKFWSASTQRERIAVMAAKRDIAEKMLELKKAQVQFGTATNQDLLDAQAAAAKAGADYLAAKGLYFTKEIDLETAMGL